MRRLSLAVEELMGAQPAAAPGAAPGMMGPSKPKIALKGQPGAAGAAPGNAPMDPKQAGASLAAALAQAGGAIQGSIDAGINQQGQRAGNPDQATQNIGPQQPHTTPQLRMQQQKDELALKKGKLPGDLDDDVAKVAMNAARTAQSRVPPKPGMPQQPGQPPMESVDEGENSHGVHPKSWRRFKKIAHEYADQIGKEHVVAHEVQKDQTLLKVMPHDMAEKGGHKVLYRAKPKAKDAVTEGKMPKQFMKPDGKMSNPDDTNGFDKVTDAQAKATAKHKAAIKGDAKLGGSTLNKDSGRGTQWQTVRPGKLKSGTVKEETDVLGDEGRKAILDEFFA